MGAQSTTQKTGGGGGYRSRYRAFIQQRHPSNDNERSKLILGFGQGFINVTIFVVLVLAILTLFGFGLSRLTSQQTTTVPAEAATESTSMQVKEGGLVVPPTVYPSGHAIDTAPAKPKDADSKPPRK